MATVEQCEAALAELAGRLAAGDSARRELAFDRSMSCTIRDLDVVFGGRLKDGQLVDIRRTPTAEAQVRLTMSSDDLLALVDGRLKMASAWATGRVKVDARFGDLIKLQSIF